MLNEAQFLHIRIRSPDGKHSVQDPGDSLDDGLGDNGLEDRPEDGREDTEPIRGSA